MQKFFALAACIYIFLAGDYALAVSSLENCSLYQIGTNEFVLKLHGKNIPAPEEKFINENFCISLENTLAKNHDEINSRLTEKLSTVPLLQSISLENNISGDEVLIKFSADSRLKINSVLPSPDGYTMRIAAEKENYSQNFSLPPPPPKPKINLPNNFLPFSAEKKIFFTAHHDNLGDVLRMFMEDVGKNIIIDSSFPSTDVTMKLEGVRTDEIVNYLLKAYDLACQMSGKNTVVFGTREGLYKLSGFNSVKPFRIFHADPSKLKELLKNLAALDDNAITIDERTRTIYVNTNPAKMEEVAKIISELDAPMKQIMIHASIFEFNDTAAQDVDNALNIIYDEWQNVNISPRAGVRIEFNELLRNRVNSARTITGIFSTLERKNKGKLLANPSVIAIDGQEAAIKLTQDYAYISGKDEAGNTTTEIEEVGPQLTFTPILERDGYVRMKINIKTGDVIDRVSSGNSENLPITSNREVTTEIRVRDGMPFVIGGLYQDNETKLISRIPILGSIPLLGNLFTYKSNQHDRTQAVIVVTPYILEQ